MFVVELIASSFLDLISKQARAVCRCKRVLVTYYLSLIFSRDVPCTFSGFGQVFIVDRAALPLVASASSRRCVSLRLIPKHPTASQNSNKNILVLRVLATKCLRINTAVLI